MSKLSLRFLGLILLIVVILRFKWQDFYPLLSRISLLPLAAACFLNILRLFVESWRWNSLLKIQNIDYRLGTAFFVALSSDYAGIVTPGRLGNFIRIFYLTEETGVTLGTALSGVVMDKLLELAAIILLGWWGLTLLGAGIQTAVIIALSFVLMLAFFVLISCRPLHVFLEGVFLKIFHTARQAGRLDEERQYFYEGLGKFKSPRLLKPLLLSLLSFVVIFMQAFCIAGAMHISISFLDLARTMSFTHLVARVIPVSFFGLGSKDVAFTEVLYKNFHVAIAGGIAFSIIFLFTSFFVSAVTGAVCWTIKPIKIESKK